MSKSLLFLRVLFIAFFGLSLSISINAQTEDDRTMIITIETVNESGEQTVKKLKYFGEEADESTVDEIVDQYLTGDEKSVNVNVEIEANSNSDSEEITINGEKMDIRMEGDKVYINGEEVEEGDFGDKKVRILRMEDIESDEVKDILNELDLEDLDGNKIMMIETETESITEEKSGKGFLGIYKEVGTSTEVSEGVVVGGVTKDFPAAKAGIQKGDIILNFNGNAVNSFSELAALIVAEKPGNTVDITYLRNGEKKTVEATLIGNPERRRHAAGRWKSLDGKTQRLGDNKYKFKDADGNEKVFSKEEAFMRGRKPGRRHKSRASGSCCDTDQDCCKRNSQSSNKARLGVQIAEGQGARVVSVVKNTAAAKAGMLNGDDIIKIDKTKVNTPDELISVMSKYEPGDEVKVTYLRKGKKSKAKIVLGKTETSCCSSDSNENTRIEKQRIIIRREKEDDRSGDVKMEFENDLELNELDVYPNPTSAEMNFKFKIAKKAPTEFKIIDMTGKEVFSDKLENFSGSYERLFDFSYFPEGIYFFRINQDGKTYTEKVIYSKD